MDEMDDGSRWMDLVTGVMKEERTLPPVIQSRIRNALRAELLTSGLREDLLEKVDISFPQWPDGKPSVRIRFDPDSRDEDKRFFENFIAEKTQHYTKPGAAEFMAIEKAGGVTVLHQNGYFARNDTTIKAGNVDTLVDAVATMITNPIIKAEFSKPQGFRTAGE